MEKDCNIDLTPFKLLGQGVKGSAYKVDVDIKKIFQDADITEFITVPYVIKDTDISPEKKHSRKEIEPYFHHCLINNLVDDYGTNDFSKCLFKQYYYTVCKNNIYTVLPLFEKYTLSKVFNKVNSETLLFCHFAILFTIGMYQSYNLVHNDLHLNNIFLEKIDEKLKNKIACFEFKSKKFYFPLKNIQYIPKIGDWGMACRYSKKGTQQICYADNLSKKAALCNDVLRVIARFYSVTIFNNLSALRKKQLADINADNRDYRVETVLPHPLIKFLHQHYFITPLNNYIYFSHTDVKQALTQILSNILKYRTTVYTAFDYFNNLKNGEWGDISSPSKGDGSDKENIIVLGRITK